MMRKIVCIAALAAALAFPTDSMARRGGGGGGFHGGGARGFHGGGVHRGFHGGVHRGAVVHRGVVVGGRGRYWHGRYYGYGVGPCWRNDYGAWVWICN